MRSLQKLDVTFTVTYRLEAVERSGNQLVAHAILPADDLGQPEIGDDQRENDEGGGDQAVAGAGHGNGPEGPPPACTK